MQENAGTLWDWRFLINTAQLFCINDRISYILVFTGLCRLMKGVAKQNIIFLEFYIS